MFPTFKGGGGPDPLDPPRNVMFTGTCILGGERCEGQYLKAF